MEPCQSSTSASTSTPQNTGDSDGGSSSTNSNQSTAISTGAAVGIAIGALVGIALIIGAIVLFARKQRRNKNLPRPPQELPAENVAMGGVKHTDHPDYQSFPTELYSQPSELYAPPVVEMDGNSTRSWGQR